MNIVVKYSARSENKIEGDVGTFNWTDDIGAETGKCIVEIVSTVVAAIEEYSYKQSVGDATVGKKTENDDSGTNVCVWSGRHNVVEVIGGKNQCWLMNCKRDGRDRNKMGK